MVKGKMKRIRIHINVQIDDEEYVAPSDGDVAQEFEDNIRDFIYEIDGVKLKTIRVTSEEI
jgi:predicted transglutaminase-like protease|tara:strand:- start:768 stop:950 length:183 start_codon:yes stop_codon:yes gene_type:complete